MRRMRILIVDDEISMQYTLTEVLTAQGHLVEVAADGFEALARVAEFAPHIVVCDYSMPKMNGLEVLRKLREKNPNLVVIMMTAYGTEEIAVEAMKLGAFDYFAKPFSNEEMLLRIGSAGDRLNLEEENEELKKRVEVLSGTPTLLWTSVAMAEIDATIAQVAETDVTVLIEGESGTGKELVASSVHRRSKRRNRPFVKLNCAALPEPLIESELFGYDAGAFTGAVGQRKGKFEQAHGGTIFLDEIGDMTVSTQTKVLRVLQEREFERLGGHRTIRVDVRVIAATHQDLRLKMGRGEFREDLYYRLNVVSVRLPALRERAEDIELLANHFIETYSERFGKEVQPLPAGTLERMRCYHWPGNVRELENSVARAVVLDSYDKVVPSHEMGREVSGGRTLPAELFSKQYREAKADLLENFERRYLMGMVERAGGNVSKAAKMAGMHRKNFWEKLQKYQKNGEGVSVGDDAPSDERDDE